MNEKEYNKTVGMILAGKRLSEDQSSAFVAIITQMEDLLNDTDQDDYFGTEGWKHVLGWD